MQVEGNYQVFLGDWNLKYKSLFEGYLRFIPSSCTSEARSNCFFLAKTHACFLPIALEVQEIGMKLLTFKITFANLNLRFPQKKNEKRGPCCPHP